MKKLIPLFTLFVVLLFPIHGKCAEFALTAESLEYISTGFESMEYSSYAQFGFIPLSGEAKQSPYQTFGNTNINNMLTNAGITDVYTFDTLDYDTWNDTQTWEEFITIDGKTVVNRDDVRIVDFNNGYYQGRAFVSSDGKLLKRADVADAQTLCNIQFGGNALSQAEWGFLGVDVSQAIQDSNYSYNYQTHSTAGNMYYYNVTARPGDGGLPGSVWSCYIANQYIPGLIVPTNGSSGTSITSWYTNNPNLIELKDITNVTHLNNDGILSVTPGNYTKNGYTYNYQVTLSSRGGVASHAYNGTLLDYFDNTSGDYSSYQFGNYSSCVYQYIDGTYVDVFCPTNNVGKMDMTAVYGLDDVIDTTADNVIGKGVSPNYGEYNPSQANEGVFPLVWDWTMDWDLDLPIPNKGVRPHPGEDDEPIVVPGITEIIPVPDEEEITLPIIEDLQNRFPFSIPWDIKNMLYGLRARAVAPNFHISWYIRPLHYTWEFDLDLSPFSAQAEIFRNCVLISFIIGLALFSFRHFFGQ